MLVFTLNKQVRASYQPKKPLLGQWINHTLIQHYAQIYLDITIVSAKTSLQYNDQFRQKSTPTNVIALEYQDFRDNFAILAGEIILCDEIIVKEAIAQNKTIISHYAHMVVHGMLHLQGFDHIKALERKKMEQLEQEILAKCGYTNPYQL